MVSYATRLASFTSWSHTCPSASAVAHAGFHQEHDPRYSDLVVCSSCGLDPFGWNDDPDDPFDYHVTRSPKCPFVRATQQKKKRNEKTRQQYKRRTLQLATHEAIQLATHEAIQLVTQEVTQEATPPSPPAPPAPQQQCTQSSTQPVAQQTEPSENTTENTVKNIAKHTTENTAENTAEKSSTSRAISTKTTGLLSTISHSVIKPFCGETPLHAGLSNAPLLIDQHAQFLTFQLASLPGYIRSAEEMEATGQG